MNKRQDVSTNIRIVMYFGRRKCFYYTVQQIRVCFLTYRKIQIERLVYESQPRFDLGPQVIEI